MLLWGNYTAGEVEPGPVAYGAGVFALAELGGDPVWTVLPSASLGWGAGTNGTPGLTLTGGWAGQSCRLQSAAELPATNWADLYTFTNSGSPVLLADPAATNYSQRFYRVAMP
jgi:hypothetical protein